MADARAVNSIRILLLNPNSSHAMTHGMEEALRSLDLPKSIEIQTYTAPAVSPASINDDKDLVKSTEVVLSDFADREDISSYDAILVACYSVHPLVARLCELSGNRTVVLGIFESSILAALALLPPYASSNGSLNTWGIVTTGSFWEDHLSQGVRRFLGQEPGVASLKFAGVFSTGLVAGDFHGVVPQETIHAKLQDAAKRLFASSPVSCVVMGCAGMAGLEKILRAAAVEAYGMEVGSRVSIIDGVKAGIGLLDQTVRNKRVFGG